MRTALGLLIGTWHALAGCGSRTTVVSTPAAADASRSQTDGTERAIPVACGKPWSVEVIGGGGHVVVACPDDVQRVELDPNGPIARSLAPALDPARERICGCIGKVKPPPFVDLVFESRPEEGRVSVKHDENGDLDPELGPPFVACIGTVVTTFVPLTSQACSDAGQAKISFPVRLELD